MSTLSAETANNSSPFMDMIMLFGDGPTHDLGDDLQVALGLQLAFDICHHAVTQQSTSRYAFGRTEQERKSELPGGSTLMAQYAIIKAFKRLGFDAMLPQLQN